MSAVVAAALPKHSVFSLRAEQPGTLDLSFDRTGITPRSRRDLVFVVNPRGANGRTGREWKRLLPDLRRRLGEQCNIHESFTSGPSQAMDITREAIRGGADAVIAVGGDGTLHEVVNGFFWAGKPICALERGSIHATTLGLIPLGTGSDFARTYGWKNDPHQAIERIAKGFRSKIDVGLMILSGGEQHYFINVADIHLSANAGYYASKYKSFGNFCYVLGALRAFIGHRNQDLKIKVNEQDWEVYGKVTALCIGNAKFFGGGMKIVPTADPCSGDLEVVILQDFKWYDFVFKLYKLYNGSHLSEKNVYSTSQKFINILMGAFITGGVVNRRVKSIEVAMVEANGDVYVQSDGEHLGLLPVKCSILPSVIDFFV